MQESYTRIGWPFAMNNPSTLTKPTRVQAIDRGRQSLHERAWGAAFAELSSADREQPIEPVDLAALAQVALLIGREAEGADLLARAHLEFLSRGEIQRAARCAFWLGFTALLNGEVAQASGWLSRTERLLEGQPDCVEKGYLRLPVGYQTVHAGDPETAYLAFSEAAEFGNRFGDTDLVTLARQGQGRSLIRQGDVQRGVSLLDEAMVAVTAGEVSPLVAGGVYCSVIEACGEIFDLGRAREWTAALEQWCASQPDVVPYRGHCLVRRAEILQLHGAWPDALDEARRACACLSQSRPKAPVGAALYRLAELHRLRGEFTEAEEAYRQASLWHRTAQPGLARLRLAQGQNAAAKMAIRRLADEVLQVPGRVEVLDAYVEIALANRDVPAARNAAAELSEIASRHGAPYLRALSNGANGSVLLAEGNAREALAALQQSCATWSELDAPYETARVRVLLAGAYRDLGDHDAAELEISHAHETFARLGATPDLARLTAHAAKKSPRSAGSLSVREVQVLKLVASGKTNRAIASKLGISEKTVARHISNIFNKLDLNSRAAATAYAYQNKIV